MLGGILSSFWRARACCTFFVRATVFALSSRPRPPRPLCLAFAALSASVARTFSQHAFFLTFFFGTCCPLLFGARRILHSCTPIFRGRSVRFVLLDLLVSAGRRRFRSLALLSLRSRGQRAHRNEKPPPPPAQNGRRCARERAGGEATAKANACVGKRGRGRGGAKGGHARQRVRRGRALRECFGVRSWGGKERGHAKDGGEKRDGEKKETTPRAATGRG